jgi:predicted nuclease of predicted toxin-antitoxin system
MKLLLDANISWHLMAKLKSIYEDCFHVDHVGLNIPPKDMEIWKFAMTNNLIIVTNDDDFLNLANEKGFPPKVVLLRTGNQSSNYVFTLLTRHIEDIRALVISQEYGFLEIF